MALTFGSIGSRYSLVKSDQLNPADRAYLDECRRNSATHLDIDTSRLQPHPLASSKLSINPYHESFRAAQHQLLQQRILHRAAKNAAWSWKRTILLTIVLASIITAIIVVACVYAKEVRHGHYVKYFSLLIGILLVGCFVVVAINKLYPWITTRLCNSKNVQNQNEQSSDASQELNQQNITVTIDENQ